MDRKTVLSEYVKNEIIRNSNAQLGEDDDLLSSGILDSLSILKLVDYIDSTFGIEVPDEDVVYENFNSLNAIVNYLQKYT